MFNEDDFSDMQRKIYDRYYEEYFKDNRPKYYQLNLNMLKTFEYYLEHVSEDEILKYMYAHPELKIWEVSEHFADMMPADFWSDEIEPDDMDDEE